MDLVISGRPLHEILAAGQWRSDAFVKFVNKSELEAAAIMETQIHASVDVGVAIEAELVASDEDA